MCRRGVLSQNKVLLQYFVGIAGENVKIRLIDDVKLIVHGIHDIFYIKICGTYGETIGCSIVENHDTSFRSISRREKQ